METSDINFWLESWIPFDLGHQNFGNENEYKKISPVVGRFVDWRGSPTDWTIYHPSFYDHRAKGNMRRWIARCLNLNTRYNNISINELNKAFNKAKNGENVLVSVTNHDFRDMVSEVENFVRDVKSKYEISRHKI